MNKILLVEINCLCIAFLLIIFINDLKSFSRKVKDQLAFDFIVVLSMLVLLVDGLMWAVDKVPNHNTLNWIISTFYYFLSTAASLAWALYSSIKVNETYDEVKRHFVFYLAPILINTVLCLVNLHNGLMFTIDEFNVYSRGPYFLLSPLLSLYYLGLGSYTILKAKKGNNKAVKKEYNFLLCYILPPVIGALVQTLIYGTNLIWAGTTISIFLVYSNVQNRLYSTDELTQISNRSNYIRKLHWYTHNPKEGFSLYAIVLDVDHFKDINDSYGHETGDEALRTVAHILTSVCQNEDAFVARMGGDEFVILCYKKDFESLEALLEAISEAMDNANADSHLIISLSQGYAKWEGVTSQTPDSFIAQADRMMYKNKMKKQKKYI